MNILLTNDDGYKSGGLMLLCQSLAETGHNVYVFAPNGQRSAYSHATNFYKDITVERLQSYCGATQAYICSGTPVDCVKIAVDTLGVQFDLLISGPNNGENVGVGILYSGTVGAAEEGVLNGIKSIALSRLGYHVSYASAVEYVAQNLQALHALSLPDCVLNINVPNLPLAQIKGVRVCKHSASNLFDDFVVDKGDGVVQISGTRAEEKDTLSDVYLSEQGYITLTPLSVARTDLALLDDLRGLEK